MLETPLHRAKQAVEKPRGLQEVRRFRSPCCLKGVIWKPSSSGKCGRVRALHAWPFSELQKLRVVIYELMDNE